MAGHPTARAPWWRFDAMRLSSRMAMLSVLLLLAVQLVGFGVIHTTIERNARSQLAEQLTVGERIWQRLLEQRATQLAQGAAVLAADYAFREAVGTHDNPTIVSALDNHGARIDASVAAFLDTELKLVATSDASDSALLPVLAALAPQLARRTSAVAAVGQRPYQFVMVPMKSPLLVGFVVMGFALDATLAEDMHALSGLDATLVLQPASAAPRVLLSSLAPAQATALQQTLAAAPAEGQLLIDGTPHLVRSVALTAGDGPRIRAMLTSSLARAIEPFRSLQLTLAALTLIGLLLFALGSILTARRVTQPLRSLARASERLGRGDYDAPLEHTHRRDEIGELAKAFDHMRVNIAAQQGEIRLLAYWDRLTGLPNRVQFRDAVRAAIARSNAAHEHIAVLMLDLDRFKNVNDALGYASGDSLLKGVAERLQQAMQSQAAQRAALAGGNPVSAGDLLARLGGDEFALLLPGADARAASALAEQLLLAFEAPLTLIDQAVDLSAGVGIACWPEHAADADALLIRAEVAMYAAKAHTGGAQVYDPAIDTASALTLSLLSELRHALEHDELRLYLQPKIALSSGRATGAEALVRWQHPQRGLVPPLQFIPFAERTGFIRRITLWIFEETARYQAELQRLGIARISVNLSTRDLLDHELPAKLDTLLQRHGAVAQAFCLEITESAIMDDPERAEATLNRLAERGFKLSIDDYGTGYSSLAYLQRLPVNELKIDKAFVMAMVNEPGAATIVRSTIDLAHNLGLTVVAEGVENAAILEHLRSLHCDDAQGFHMSKPLPVAEFEAWMLRWQALNPPSRRTP
ncbi:putative bifunctional diguanylate cyclase/phosphodiesterase [Aquabacterium sp.]|uniref:putative bifunctional diguanylate cyclase/phosphodiesterase n=1 Tax=Aquabacterium sp. TaxID=1872578 RepID=UPI002BDC14D4|nr:EAL domain-containing protein [Aquabacterium sp.]HSW05353.1 EAL domain-containing protein [Aquabacterium sp.]